MVLPPVWPDLAPSLADVDADLDVAVEPGEEALAVPLSGFAVGLVDFAGDVVDDFLGEAVADVFEEGDDVPPGALQLTPPDAAAAEGLGDGAVVGPVVAVFDAGTPVGTPVLGLGGGLDTSLDELVGLDDVMGGVELSDALLVFGVVSCVAPGELIAAGQVAPDAGSWFSVVAVPAVLR